MPEQMVYICNDCAVKLNVQYIFFQGNWRMEGVSCHLCEKPASPGRPLAMIASGELEGREGAKGA